MWVPEEVKESFEKRLQTAIGLLQKSNIQFSIVGIFGSYARNEYKACSDIDLCIVCEELPKRMDVALLRCDLEDLKVDCTVMSRQRYEHEDSRFMRNLRRDFRKVIG